MPICLLALFFKLMPDIKVATVIRVAVRRSVIPIHVRKAIVSAIVPITTETNSAHDVGIDEVSVAPSTPHIRHDES